MLDSARNGGYTEAMARATTPSPTTIAAAGVAFALGGCSDRAGDAPVPGGWVEGRRGMWTVERVGPGTSIGELGYAPGVGPADEGAATGVTVHDPERARPGWNLYSSGHGSEAVLMDMDGEVAHRWRLDYASIPGAPPLDGASQDCWRRVRLLDDGSLLALWGGRGLTCVDRDSRLVWHFPERAHHDLEVLADGRILVLTREERRVPAVNDRDVIDDLVVELSPAGEVLSRTSLLEALVASAWGARHLVGRGLVGDVLHVNSLRVLDGADAGRHRAFAAGSWLLCAREPNLLFVVDPARPKATWTLQGPWIDPHDPRPVGDGRLLLFDNLGGGASGGEASRLVEVDVGSHRIVWEWRADPPGSFFSRFCGAAARLENGNTLVTETGAGRAFELAPDRTRVWEFRTPHRAGEHGELIAALFEIERVDVSRLAWLDR